MKKGIQMVTDEKNADYHKNKETDKLSQSDPEFTRSGLRPVSGFICDHLLEICDYLCFPGGVMP